MKKVIFVLLFLYCLYSILNGDIMIYRYGTFNLNGFEPEIIDSRAESLGRYSLLSSSGANYLFNNPSLLSKLNDKNTQVSYRIIYGEAKRKRDDSSYSSTDYYKCHIKINGIAVCVPYIVQRSNKLKFNFAIGFRSYIDWGYKVETSDYITNSNGGSNFLVLGSSMCVNDKYYIGFSYNYPFLSTHALEVVSKTGAYDNYLSNGTLNASFIVFSTSYVINKTITLGARFRPDFKLEREYKIDDDEDITINEEYDIPYELAIAVKISPSEQIDIFTEYLTRNLGEYKLNDGYMYSFDDNDKSANGYTIRAGFEYRKKYRLGFFSQTVPIYKFSNYSQDESNKPQKEFGFTVGYGFIIFSNLNINIFSSYSFLNYDEWRVHYTLEYSDFRIKAGCSMGYSF